ncbi:MULTISPECIES: VWA domain-containing protein [Actinomadura]|uniref:VWA domain-containing protein n=1 Tax=Actinomadura geliboluensis TaxID=882440 RepID=A0A5S4GTS5_9ACTN|nr:VWA domain-containing protein [Actinomadura geliboluensis]TMR36132.1 VWA domain-containing protein [Actinomadura geliboluensis]
MITRRWFAGGGVLGLLAALTLFGAPPGTADDGGAEGPAEPPKVELVLDVSGSMRARDIDGRSRMAAAQQALNEVVDALPGETQLGIRVLGSQYRFPGSPKSVGCRDTRQLFPVGPMNKVEAKTAIATLRPTGWTPIGLALRAAARDLGTGETTRRIVLITDGEDTCSPPDPCEVARKLAAQGTHLVVDTLGLTLDEKVRRQLTCIADATGGTYTAVQHQEELTGRLNQLVQRAGATYRQTPQQVAGGAQCANAPLLTRGVYTDRERFSEHRWYRVQVAPGQELRASISLSLDRRLNPDHGVLLRAVSTDGQELVRGTDAGSGRTDVRSTGLRWAERQVKADASPTSDGGPELRPVCLVVSNSFSSPTYVRTAPGMPLELTVDLVPSSDAPGGPDLGRGWLLLVVLTGTGLVAGLVMGWLARWRVAIWKEN